MPVRGFGRKVSFAKRIHAHAQREGERAFRQQTVSRARWIGVVHPLWRVAGARVTRETCHCGVGWSRCGSDRCRRRGERCPSSAALSRGGERDEPSSTRAGAPPLSARKALEERKASVEQPAQWSEFRRCTGFARGIALAVRNCALADQPATR